MDERGDGGQNKAEKVKGVQKGHGYYPSLFLFAR